MVEVPELIGCTKAAITLPSKIIVLRNEVYNKSVVAAKAKEQHLRHHSTENQYARIRGAKRRP